QPRGRAPVEVRRVRRADPAEHDWPEVMETLANESAPAILMPAAVRPRTEDPGQKICLHCCECSACVPVQGSRGFKKAVDMAAPRRRLPCRRSSRTDGLGQT